MKYFRTRCLQTVLLALCMSAVCGTANAADNIVEVADKAGTFKTLLEAAKAAGLVHALQEEGPLTVFAPTDDAFAKFPKHALNDLLKPENKEKLATILKYHVIAGKIAAKDALQAESAATLSGDSVSIALRDGRLAVNDANVIVNDVETSNGIIHVIDQVLLPPEKLATSFTPGADVALLPRIDPKFGSSLASESGGETVSISFCNLSPKPMLVYWVMHDGTRKQWRGEIFPGTLDVCESTYQNHVWLIADEHGKTLGLYIVGDRPAVIVNTR